MTDELLGLLSGDAPTGLSEELQQDLESTLRSALEAEQFGEVAEWVEGQFTQHPQDVRVRFLTAVLQEIEEDPRRAAVTLRELARALADADDWANVRTLSLRSLHLRPDDRAVRLLVRAWDRLEKTPQREEDLALARELCPEAPELSWDASLAAEAAGDTLESQKLACQAMVAFAKIKEPGQTEDALMRALESESGEVLTQVVESLPVLARAGMAELVDTALEFVEPEIASRRLHGPVTATLEILLTESTEFGRWRPLHVATMVERLGGEDAVGALVRACGLADPDTPFREARQRFEELSILRRGAYVEHKSWGLGHVTGNDGESLTIDFEERLGHRMGIDMAIRSLTPLPSELLRVRAFADRDDLQSEATEDPVAVLIQALEEAGGEAGTQDLRRALGGVAVPAGKWAAWWTKAKKAMAADARIDDSDAYRQLFRLGSESGETTVSVPPLDASKGLRPAVASIGRLLKQHPQLADAAAAVYGPELNARLATAVDPEERLSVLPLLSQWYPDRRGEWQGVLEGALAVNAGVAAVTGETDQSALLSLGVEGESWLRAALSALPSRFTGVRKQALATLEERGGDSLAADLIEALKDARNRPEDALALAELSLKGTSPVSCVAETDPWHLFLAVATVLSVEVGPRVRERARTALAPTGALAKRLSATPCPESLETLCRMYVVRDTLSAPSLQCLADFLEAVGADELAEPVRVRLAPPDESDAGDNRLALAGLRPGPTYMTRRTHDLQQTELRRLEHRLRVELPDAIKRARELGDLSENAEYHAAREEQGIVGSQVANLRHALESAAFIEDVEPRVDLVTLGTKVRVEYPDTGSEELVWLLGEGDGHYGEEVVSYTAQLGQSLLARTPGEEFEFEVDQEVTRVKVVSFEPALPIAD